MKYSRGTAKFTKVFKCSHCGNAGDFLYLGSRNLNEGGELKDLVGSEEVWMSYYRCPVCGNVEPELHPVGEKPDVPGEVFKEISKGK